MEHTPYLSMYVLSHIMELPMTDSSATKPSSPKRLAWTTGILCVACCAVPLVGIAIGSTTLAAFAVYSEGAAMAVLGMALLAYILISRRRAPSCDIDCSSRPKLDKGGAPSER